jgi:hypothetical protein
LATRLVGPLLRPALSFASSPSHVAGNGQAHLPEYAGSTGRARWQPFAALRSDLNESLPIKGFPAVSVNLSDLLSCSICRSVKRR